MASEFNKVTLSTLDENNKAPNYMELVGVAMEQGNSILMAAATEIDAPLRQTIIEGVIQNAPLHEGIANLKGVANSSGLIAAVDNAVAGMREAHEDQRGLMVDMAKGMSANLIKEMNSNPEFAKHFSTLLAVAMTEGANGVGLNKEVAQKVINDAAAIASEAIEKGEKIDYKPSLNIIGEKVLGALEKQSVPATDALKAKQASKGGIA